MDNYKELIVWQKAMNLVEMVYKIAASFPEMEKYGLGNQIRRSAISIPYNISEGAGRNSKKEFRNFLGIANGSLNELLTQLELSSRLGYTNSEAHKDAMVLRDEIQKMLFSLSNKFSEV